MARVAPGAQIYFSRTKEQAEAYLKDALARGYNRVIAGGGDGTLMTVATAVRREVDAIRARMADPDSDTDPRELYPLPELGVLRLGTGNAVAEMLSAGDPVRDMHKLLGLPTVPLTRLDLLEVEKQSAPFLGFGYDALVLNEYEAVKRAAKSPFMRAMLEGVQGYLYAAFAKAVPKQLFRRRRVVARVMNGGGKVYSVSYSHGLHEVDVGEGELFYSGPITMLSCGTVPMYGFKFTMFPFARILPGFAHLRIARTGLYETLRNLPSVWRGTFSSPTIEEYLVESVRIRFSEPMPLQIGGDAAGYRRDIVLRVHDEPFHVLDLNPLADAA